MRVTRNWTIDRVDPETFELACAETEDFLQGTFLEGAPVLPISSVTGEGFEGSYDALATLMRTVRPKQIDGVFRLPLDRALSVKGHAMFHPPS